MGKTQVGAAFLTIMKYHWSAIVPATAQPPRGQRKPLIVATNNSNASTLSERYCLFTPLKRICHKWWKKRPTPGTVQHLLREFGCGHYRIRHTP